MSRCRLNPALKPVPRTIRAAIYCRKSTSAGLDKAFNSIDAQREACERFLKNQGPDRWVPVGEVYADGGYSGGNTDRPALQRLLSDIEAGRVDAIIVYKLDRLSRSLIDFAGIMERLKPHGIPFVSVTEQFDTSTSAGRLHLNILMMFAQYERELIAERTRDKVRAARRKGKWTGGNLVLGYDIASDGGRLVVNEDEADQVREIFELYLDRLSVREVAEELNEKGWRTKSWVTKKGVRRPGRSFTVSSLHYLLSNPIYLGKVRLYGELFPGEHPGIVPVRTWKRVQILLRRNGRTNGALVRNKHAALLRGLVFCASCRVPLQHSVSTRRNKVYRYYVCPGCRKGGTRGRASIPAGELEDFVVERIPFIGRDPELVRLTVRQANRMLADRRRSLERETRGRNRELEDRKGELASLAAAFGKGKAGEEALDQISEMEREIRDLGYKLKGLRGNLDDLKEMRVDGVEVERALAQFDPVWNVLYPRERERFVRLLLERVEYDTTKSSVSLVFHPTGIKTLAFEKPERGTGP